MKTATITQAKNQLSALIDQVQAGETIVILERGRPVARLEPVTGQTDPSGRLARLERAGIIKRGTGAPPIELMREPPPRLPAGMSVLDALLEERREGR